MLDGLCTYLRGSGDATTREYIGGASGATNFTWASDDGSYHDFLIEIRGVGDNNPFDGVGTLVMTMYIDSNQAISFTTTANPCTNNYIGFEVCDNASLYIENLTVSQVPEPTTVALLASGLFGLLAYA